MKQIWKYSIDDKDWAGATILMPIGSTVLTAQIQRGVICIWAEVDPKKEQSERMFEIVGTGHTLREDMGTERKYISTVQDIRGLVWHIYERLN